MSISTNERRFRSASAAEDGEVTQFDVLVVDHVGVVETFSEQGDHEGDAALARTADLFGAATQVAANDAMGDASAGRAAWDAVRQQRAA